MTYYEEDQNVLAEELVAPLIQVMQSGKLPWRRPWSAKGLLGQHNLYTGLSYNGFNVMFLMVAKHCSQYEHSAWLTRRQGRELKWTLRPGAKGCRILKPVFRSPNQVRIDPETGKPMVDRWGNEVKGAHAVSFKSSVVFNASDFREGPDSVKTVAELLPKPVETPVVEADESGRLKYARKVLEAWDREECRATFDCPEASYFFKEDLIGMPPIGSFDTRDEFYGTWAHEIIHSTGHRYRLGRFDDYGSVASYAYEELVAELGSFILSGKLKLSTDLLGHASYLQVWAEILGAEPSILFKVMKESGEAVSMIMRNSRKPFRSGGGSRFPDDSHPGNRSAFPHRKARCRSTPEPLFVQSF
jgi:antirestriction protein ArdC